MLKEKYVVTLTAEERSYLKGIVSKGKVSAMKRSHAQILLKCDTGPAGPGWTDEQISLALEVSTQKVRRVRKRLVMDGLEAALNRAKQKHRKARKIDGDAEAYLVATACSEPPEGRAGWTLKLLGDKLVELEFVESVCNETVRQALKKTS
jgi:hypothetical protein